ncbi:MAG: fumarylacetoacetate hydrolase family protein [Firmicutes bacterium]|nr:fumarylacetoacetate hydrolase family protein [Bacillota bacterium]
MKIVSLKVADARTGARPMLGLVLGDLVFDLSAQAGASDFAELLREAGARHVPLQQWLREIADEIQGGQPVARYSLLESGAAEGMALGLPLVPAEVWGAGLTYERSRNARVEESVLPDLYDRAYRDERPELFFKDSGRRTVGPGEPIGVRSDSTWTVPEPELALVLGEGAEVVAVTLGDDVTARDIEAQNALYLPQAKIFDRCCALGPALVPAREVDLYDLEMRCRIIREGRVVFEGATSTRLLRRRFEYLVSCLVRSNPLPAGTVLLTGTGIVPPDDVALRPGDMVEIEAPAIGVLRNPVAQV